MKKKIFITLLLMVFSIISVFIFASCNDTNIESIEISGMPTKLSYYTGEELNYDGIQVKIEYKDKKLSDIISSDLITVVAPDMTSSGEKVVTVKYNEKNKEYSTSYTITVKDHTYSNTWSSDDETHWHSCLDEGYSSLKGDEALNDYDDGEVITQATDYQSGEIKYTCKICGHEKTEIIPQKATVYYSADNTKLLLRDDNTFTFVSYEDDADAHGSYRTTYENLGIIEKKDNTCLLKENEIYSYATDFGITGDKIKYDFNKKDIFESQKTYSLITLSPNVIAVAELKRLPYGNVHIYTNKLDSNKEFLTTVKATDFGKTYDCIWEKDKWNGKLYKVNKNGSFDYIELANTEDYTFTNNNLDKETGGIYEEKFTYGEMFKDYTLKLKIPSDDDYKYEDYDREIDGNNTFEVNAIPDKATILKGLSIYINGTCIYLDNPAIKILQYPDEIKQKGDYPVKISYNGKEIDFFLIIYDKDEAYNINFCYTNCLVKKGTSVEDAFSYSVENRNYDIINGKNVVIKGYDPNKLGAQCVTATCDNIVSEEAFIFVYDDSNKDTIVDVNGIFQGNTKDSKKFYDNIIIGQTYDNLYVCLVRVDNTCEYVKFDTSKIEANIDFATNTVSVFGFYDIEQENKFTLHLNVTVGYTDVECLSNCE